MVLLAPVARKAHMLFALPALQLFLMVAFREGWGPASRWAKAAAAVLAALFLAGRSLPLDMAMPWHGSANPALLLATVATAAFLALAPLPGGPPARDEPSRLP
jgi:hypothetical protein